MLLESCEQHGHASGRQWDSSYIAKGTWRKLFSRAGRSAHLQHWRERFRHLCALVSVSLLKRIPCAIAEKFNGAAQFTQFDLVLIWFCRSVQLSCVSEFGEDCIYLLVECRLLCAEHTGARSRNRNAKGQKKVAASLTTSPGRIRTPATRASNAWSHRHPLTSLCGQNGNGAIYSLTLACGRIRSAPLSVFFWSVANHSRVVTRSAERAFEEERMPCRLAWLSLELLSVVHENAYGLGLPTRPLCSCLRLPLDFSAVRTGRVFSLKVIQKEEEEWVGDSPFLSLLWLSLPSTCDTNLATRGDSNQLCKGHKNLLVALLRHQNDGDSKSSILTFVIISLRHIGVPFSSSRRTPDLSSRISQFGGSVPCRVRLWQAESYEKWVHD